MSELLYAEQTTLLRIYGPGVSPYASRGLSQTLDPIDASAQMWRCVDGGLIDVSAPQFRKYHSVISCTDQNVPALDGVWPGQEVIVDCIKHLSYKTDGGSPDRIVVPGSMRVEGEFTLYRPRLTMLVVNHNETEDEWGAVVQWSLELEEK